MVLPFSLACGCCPSCRGCPCDSGTIPTSIQMTFDDWAAAPTGYCHSCDELNTTIEVPSVDDFHYGTEIGDAYDLLSPKYPCSFDSPTPGVGCMYAVDEEIECVPQSCFDSCASACYGTCTDDEGCSPEGCEDPSCTTDLACTQYGGTCEVECSQAMACVFDEELDPDHLAGTCTGVGDCAASVVAGSCWKIHLRLRAIFYVTVDLKAAVSVQVILSARTLDGTVVATILYGFHEFDDDRLDCAAFDFDLPLFPISGYTQPSVPSCGAPTSVRITGLP